MFNVEIRNSHFLEASSETNHGFIDDQGQFYELLGIPDVTFDHFDVSCHIHQAEKVLDHLGLVQVGRLLYKRALFTASGLSLLPPEVLVALGHSTALGGLVGELIDDMRVFVLSSKTCLNQMYLKVKGPSALKTRKLALYTTSIGYNIFFYQIYF